LKQTIAINRPCQRKTISISLPALSAPAVCYRIESEGDEAALRVSVVGHEPDGVLVQMDVVCHLSTLAGAPRTRAEAPSARAAEAAATRAAAWGGAQRGSREAAWGGAQREQGGHGDAILKAVERAAAEEVVGSREALGL